MMRIAFDTRRHNHRDNSELSPYHSIAYLSAPYFTSFSSSTPPSRSNYSSTSPISPTSSFTLSKKLYDITLMAIDTSGQRAMDPITKGQYIRGVHSFAILYNVTMMETFEGVERWREMIESVRKEGEKNNVVLVGWREREWCRERRQWLMLLGMEWRIFNYIIYWLMVLSILIFVFRIFAFANFEFNKTVRYMEVGLHSDYNVDLPFIFLSIRSLPNYPKDMFHLLNDFPERAEP